MKTDKAVRREAKRHKAQHGMRTAGRSVFLLQALAAKVTLNPAQRRWFKGRKQREKVK